MWSKLRVKVTAVAGAARRAVSDDVTLGGAEIRCRGAQAQRTMRKVAGLRGLQLSHLRNDLEFYRDHFWP